MMKTMTTKSLHSILILSSISDRTPYAEGAAQNTSVWEAVVNLRGVFLCHFSMASATVGYCRISVWGINFAACILIRKSGIEANCTQYTVCCR